MAATQQRYTRITHPIPSTSTYSGGGANYRKQMGINRGTKQGRAHESRVRRERKRQREIRRIIEYGMEGQDCWFVTIVHGHCLDTGLRADVWHPVRTLLLHTYPTAAACTILEWGQDRGIHLHVIIAGISDYSPEWMERAVARIRPGAQCHCTPVYDPIELARYVSKQLADQTITTGWPRHTRPFTKTANWPVPPDLQRPTKRDKRCPSRRLER